MEYCVSVLTPTDGKRRNIVSIGQLGCERTCSTMKENSNDCTDDVPLALRPTSRTGQGHHQVSFQARRQGGKRTGGTCSSRTEFDSREGALSTDPPRSRVS